MSAKAQLIQALRSVLPACGLLTDEEDLRPYECDGLSAYTCLPLLVAMPETLDQVQTILKACYKLKVPVVARGAGTGLSGGALPHAQGVLLSLAKLNQVLEVDALARTATVQPGVRNLAISQAVDHLDLFYAPDPSSQIACTIGGNVAENAGGVHCLKYGLTLHNVMAVKLLTIQGDLLELGSPALDSPGYDLLALITGSEGLLGIVVEVTVKLTPKPQSTELLLAAFDDVVKAANAVSSVISSGIIPAGMELMDAPAIKATENFIHAGYPLDAQAILLCEIDGLATQVESQLDMMAKLLKENGAYEVRRARDEQQRLTFWSGRKNAFPAVGSIAPDYYCMDGTIPRHQLGHVLKKIYTLAQDHKLQVVNVFHAGDGNLHPLILYDNNIPGQLAQVEELGSKILELCIQAGGTITGEHGVGIEKINQMCMQFTSAELNQFHAIKTAFDEHRLLNPEKAIPTLKRCSEWGGMHVHKGNLPFPDIERF